MQKIQRFRVEHYKPYNYTITFINDFMTYNTDI